MITTLPADSLDLPLDLSVEEEEQLPAPVLVPFTMGGNEPNCGATDVTALTPAPAGKHGWVRVNEEGHFVDGENRRIRFLGVNLTFGNAFPDHETAEQLGRRLASMGINAVRIHHIDGRAAPGGIWKKQEWLDTFDPEQVDKFDYLIAQLKKNGVYVDLNLHVSYSYWQGKDYAKDGLKDNAARDRFLPTFGKGIDRIEDDFIEQQKDYARRLLGHKNPYTGLTYADDPVIAIVEINNESSLHSTDPMRLPAWYRKRIQAKFNAWLREKYGTSEALNAAWSGKAVPLSDKELIVRKPVSQTDRYLSIRAESPNDFTVTLKETPEVAYRAEAVWGNLNLKAGELYTLSFSARSENPCTISYNVSLQMPNWNNCGLRGGMEAGTDWTEHTVSFHAANAVPYLTRLVLTFGQNNPGTFEVRDVSLRKGGKLGLAADESLEAGTVRPVSYVSGAPGRPMDWKAFVTHTEKVYGETFRKLLREELGYKGLIFDSQTSYGGMLGQLREISSDVIDNHDYWKHPEWLGIPWKGNDWVVQNVSMAALPEKGANLGRKAVWRVASKPYTITEFCHPAPNSYVAESLPMWSAYAALQDWDGIFHFDWGFNKWSENRIGGFFSLHGNPARLVFLPAAAVIFRAAAAVPLAASAQLLLPGGERAFPALAAGNANATDLWEQAGLRPEEFIHRRLSLAFDPAAGKPRLERQGPAADAATAAFNWNEEAFRLDVPAAKVLVGAVTGRSHTFTDAAFALAPSASGFAAITLTAMDLQPVRASRTLLLTVAAAVENTNQRWKKGRHGVYDWGSAPTLCEMIVGTASVQTDAESDTVYALDGKGNRKRVVPSTLKDGTLTFSMGPEHATLWYEIETR